MHNILLIGNPDHIQPFVDAAPPGESFTTIDPMIAVNTPGDWLGGYDVPKQIDIVVDLTINRTLKELVLRALAGQLSSETVYISNVLTMTATDAASRLGGGQTTVMKTDIYSVIAARTAREAGQAPLPTVIGISYIPHMFATGNLLEAAVALGTAPDKAERALGMLHELTSKEIEVVGDRVGLVSARTLAMIVNEGAFALMEGVAEAADIDTAMKLGTNYPEGPLAWADQIGPDIILDILDALHNEYNEERYRPCVLLKQLVRSRGRFGGNDEI